MNEGGEAQAESGATFDPQLFEALARAEEKHFWFRSRNVMIRSVIARIVSDLPDGFRVLEVGCGTANVLRVLESACSRGTVAGMDLYWGGLSVARGRTECSLVQADMFNPPFDAVWDAIGLFDVLEHLTDDRNVLRDLRAMLGDSGRLVLTVPAHPSLWSYSDMAARHQRRYTEDDLAEKLDETGYTLEYMSQFMSLVLPLAWLARTFSANRSNAVLDGTERNRELFYQELKIVPGVNGILRFLLELETPFIARGKRIPFGTSLIAIARKKG